MTFFFEDHGTNWNINNDIFGIFAKLVFNATFFTVFTDKGFAMTEIKQGIDVAISS